MGEECRCKDETDVRLVTYLFFANLRTSAHLSRVSDRQAAACNEILERTCRDVANLWLDGHAIGSIGAGVRQE